MIDLTWNTKGRMSVEDYRKARWRHIAFCLIPTVIYIAGAAAASVVSPVTVLAAFAIGSLLLSYYRYRFMQVMIKRLHDRGLFGWVLLLNPISVLIIVGLLVVASILILQPSPSTLTGFLSSGNDPIIVAATILPVIALSIFLRFQLSRKGVPGANRYGPPTGMSQASVF